MCVRCVCVCVSERCHLKQASDTQFLHCCYSSSESTFVVRKAKLMRFIHGAIACTQCTHCIFNSISVIVLDLGRCIGVSSSVPFPEYTRRMMDIVSLSLCIQILCFSICPCALNEGEHGTRSQRTPTIYDCIVLHAPSPTPLAPSTYFGCLKRSPRNVHVQFVLHLDQNMAQHTKSPRFGFVRCMCSAACALCHCPA